VATLTIEDLTKVFPPPRKGAEPVTALGGLSFELSGHTFVSLVGPSGCGKSTLLNILSSVETPTSGRLSVTQDGRPAKLGYVFQDARLLPWRTVMDNMLYVQDARDEKTREHARRYLTMVGLENNEASYPGQLSGGMQQRAGIARAFSVEPDLLLMDEPFSHLDAITARSLREHLQQLWQESGKTVLFVTHDIMEAVQLSDPRRHPHRSPAPAARIRPRGRRRAGGDPRALRDDGRRHGGGDRGVRRSGRHGPGGDVGR
jgi:NitT/TauT family transport system ATP-binding protein